MSDSLKLNNNESIPVIGLGTWKAAKPEVGSTVKFAITEAGYKHIDCASIYGNEKEIGVALDEVFTSGKVKREDIFVTSKLWNTDHHPDNVLKACKQTLRDLRLDYLDLYLVHWAVAFVPGEDKEPLDKDGYTVRENVSIRETWQAMEQLVGSGLVKSIGIANFSTIALVDLLSYCKIKPVTNQIELHPYNSQEELLRFMEHENIVATAYSPLGTPGGLRTNDPVLLEDEVIKKIAQKHKVTPGQVLLKWGIQRNTSVIPKSITKERLIENMKSLQVNLTDEDIAEINSLNRNYRFVNPINWWGMPYFG